MSSVVVQDEMDVEILRDHLIDMVEKTPKPNGAMSPPKLPYDPTGLSIQRGEQRSNAVALVIVCSALNLAWTHRKDGLRTIQRLNLCLLVNAQNQSLVWRVQVKSNDVTNLINEQRVLGQLESLGSVWSKAKRSPDTIH